MIEKNRDILSNALKNMPSRSPKPSNWDNIANGLDQLAASNFISKHKDKLPKHKAPEGAWHGISKAQTSSFSTFLRSIPGKIISAIILLGIVAGAIVIFTSPFDKEAAEKILTSEQYEPTLEEEHIVADDSKKDHGVIERDTDPTNANLASDIDMPGQSDVVLQKQLSESKKDNTTPGTTITAPTLSMTSFYDPDPKNPTKGHSFYTLQKLSSKTLSEGMVSSENNDKKLLQKPTKYRPNYGDDYVRDNSSFDFSIGLYYSYNQFQEIEYEGMSIPNNISSFGFELAYEKHNWFIKTGLGYLNWNEEASYIVDYTQNQLVYSYNYVDSAHIIPENGQTVYYTTEVDVFDSVASQNSDIVTYNYQSLQIPVLFGYKLIRGSRFNIAMLGGIAIDFKISGKQYTPEFVEEDARITGINNSLIYRTETNWRFILGLNIDYAFLKQWTLYLEPTYQQYMNPIYSPTSIKAGGMLNIKLGIKYYF
jgi:hypothetical protein